MLLGKVGCFCNSTLHCQGRHRNSAQHPAQHHIYWFGTTNARLRFTRRLHSPYSRLKMVHAVQLCRLVCCVADSCSALSVVLLALSSCGYRVSWREFDAQKLVPQTRKRLFIVGIRADISSASSFAWPQLRDRRPTIAQILHSAEMDGVGQDELEWLRLSAAEWKAVSSTPYFQVCVAVVTIHCRSNMTYVNACVVGGLTEAPSASSASFGQCVQHNPWRVSQWFPALLAVCAVSSDVCRWRSGAVSVLLSARMCAPPRLSRLVLFVFGPSSNTITISGGWQCSSASTHSGDWLCDFGRAFLTTTPHTCVVCVTRGIKRCVCVVALTVSMFSFVCHQNKTMAVQARNRLHVHVGGGTVLAIQILLQTEHVSEFAAHQETLYSRNHRQWSKQGGEGQCGSSIQYNVIVRLGKSNPLDSHCRCFWLYKRLVGAIRCNLNRIVMEEAAAPHDDTTQTQQSEFKSIKTADVVFAFCFRKAQPYNILSRRSADQEQQLDAHKLAKHLLVVYAAPKGFAIDKIVECGTSVAHQTQITDFFS